MESIPHIIRPGEAPPPRDRSHEQTAALRALVDAAGRTADAVRRGDIVIYRDQLRTAFAALDHAGLQVDDVPAALGLAISKLAGTVAAPSESDFIDAIIAERAKLRAELDGTCAELTAARLANDAARHAGQALAAELETARTRIATLEAELGDEPPPSSRGPAGELLDRLRPLVSLGRVSLQVTQPRPLALAAVDALRHVVPDALRPDSSGGATMLIALEADGVDATIHIPAPPARTSAQLRDAAIAAAAALVELEQRERGGARG